MKNDIFVGRLKGWMRPGLVVLFVLVACWAVSRTESEPSAETMAEADMAADASELSMPEDVRNLFPEAKDWHKHEGGLYEVFDQAGDALGFLALGPPPDERIIGHVGSVPFLVVFDRHLAVSGVRMLENRETASYARRVEDELHDAWNGKSPDDALEHSVEAVSGATATSLALVNGVRATLSRIAAQPPPRPTVGRGAVGGLVGRLLLLLFLGLTSGLFFGRLSPRGSRLYINLGSLLIPGLIASSMFSLALLEGWLRGSFDWRMHSVLGMVGLVTVAGALFTGRNYYCHCFCPFGAAQQLAGRLNRKWKLKWGGRLVGCARALRIILLTAAFAIVALDLAADLAWFEPFVVFNWRHAAWPGRMLALLFLGLALIIPRPWCRICPTGGLIEGLRRPRGRSPIRTRQSHA